MKKLLKRNWLLIVLLSIPYLFIVLTSIIRVDYDFISPGGLNKVNSVINIDGSSEENGSFNTVSVYSLERIPLLTYLIAKTDDIISLDESSDYIQMDYSEMYSSGTIQKNVSINNAIIVAYKTAGKHISTNYHGLIVHTVFKDISYDVKIGDIITKYNNQYISNEKEFSNQIISDVRSKKDIQLTVLRNGEEFEVDYEPIWVDDTKTSFYVGLSYYDYYTINKEETEPSFTINKANTLGPSGGLMQALSVYNAITENDITNGLKIAGTGTIDVDGNVGIIGGIYQKVFTAYFSNADVFFVPVSYDENGQIIDVEGNNYHEAKKAYELLGSPKDMAFVPVATLEEAVKYLESIA
ncbi:MAG: hypothetical protein IJX78_01150 [Bacilli bacterium]|nr:hypothetical protein [Bacilli bacterium]